MKSRDRSSLSVMLVDDHQDRAVNVRAGIEADGCEVVSMLASPMEIYEAVVVVAPDVIIIDTASPSRDSLESLAFVSKDRPYPIVMFSGDRSSETIREAIRAGVSAYVVDGFQALVRISGRKGAKRLANAWVWLLVRGDHRECVPPMG